MKSDDKADIWMPLYIGDYLADTSRLTTEQHGAYLLLMMDYWRVGPPPDDDEILQNVTRLSKFLWKKHRPVLEKLFSVVDGAWHHKRLDEELLKALADKALASEKGKKGAEVRWGKKDAPANAQALPDQWPSPSPSPSPSEQPKNLGGNTHANGTPVRASDLSSAMRRNSIEAQPGDPRIIAAAAAGVSVATIEAACAHAKASKPNQRIAPNYVVTIAMSWTAESSAPQARASPLRPANHHDERAHTIAVLTGRSRDDNPDEPYTIDAAATRIG